MYILKSRITDAGCCENHKVNRRAIIYGETNAKN